MKSTVLPILSNTVLLSICAEQTCHCGYTFHSKQGIELSPFSYSGATKCRDLYYDLYRAFISADIPPRKANYPVLRNVLVKYTRSPDESIQENSIFVKMRRHE